MIEELELGDSVTGLKDDSDIGRGKAIGTIKIEGPGYSESDRNVRLAVAKWFGLA